MLLYCFLVFVPCMLYGQSGEYVVPDYKGSAESFFSISDSLIRREAGSFSFAGSLAGLHGETELTPFGVYAQTESNITLAHEQVKVYIGTAHFVPGRHSFEYFGHRGYVYKINGRHFWGIDGQVPSRQVVAVRIYYGDRRVDLPTRAFRDIFEPNFCFRTSLLGSRECHSKAFMSADGERIYIYMRNGRIPSLYEVTWIISRGEYLGRVVDYAY